MDFKEKTADELAALSAEQLAQYYNQKNSKDRAEINRLIEEKNEQNAAKIQALQDSLREDMVKQMDHLNEALKETKLAIQAIRRDASPTHSMSFQEEVRKHLTDNLDKLKASKGSLAGAQANTFDFSVKAPGTMTIGGNVSGGNVPVEDRIPGLNLIPSRRVRIMDLLSPRATSSNVVSWVYQANKDGAAGQTAEGAAKNQIDFDLVVASQSVKKTTAYIKVSDEMLDDIEWMQSEINNELIRELLKAVEAQVYEGDGTGNNLNGIVTTATAFAAGTFANTVDNANIVDVLVVAANQIRIAEHDGPTAILMHPSDVARLKLIKLSATDKRYVERLMMVGSTMVMDGIPIIEDTLVTVDKYLIANFALGVFVTKDGVRIEIGLDSDDFTKNLRTIRAEWRGLVLVKNNDRTAFVTGDFSTDAAALETP